MTNTPLETTYLGEIKVIKHEGYLYLYTEESADLVDSIMWANKILERENVRWPNGRMSHDRAEEVLDKAEDELIKYTVLVL